MLKSERGMSRLELAITVAAIMFILGCTLLLTIGENGFSFLPKENTNNSIVYENGTRNEVTEKNEPKENIPSAEEKITSEIENIMN